MRREVASKNGLQKMDMRVTDGGCRKYGGFLKDTSSSTYSPVAWYHLESSRMDLLATWACF